jgi:hypothetical protein
LGNTYKGGKPERRARSRKINKSQNEVKFEKIGKWKQQRKIKGDLLYIY